MRKGTLAVVAIALSLAACGGQAPSGDVAAMAGADPAGDVATGAVDAEVPPGAASVEAADAADSAAAGDAALVDRNGHPVTLVAFDPDRVPVTAVALGELPVVSFPDGYGPVNRPGRRAFARFPVRLGDGLHWVEGATWNSLVGVARDRRRDKEFAPRELRRNLEAAFEQAGAVKVFEGPLRRELYYGPQLEDEIGGGFIEGVNLDADSPTTVHVVRQEGRTLWFQLSTHSHGAALVVVDEKPFEASARWLEGFPWLSLPAGYDDGRSAKSRDFDMYPFWTGSGFEEVEGRAHVTAVRADERAYSMHEVRRNIEAMMAQAGGTRVFAGRIPAEASEQYGRELKGFYSDGTSYAWDRFESLVYRVDLADGREVWLHARLEYGSAGWVVVEREGFRQTAALLPAGELRRQLDAEGRVAIEVHFAVDSTEILPSSTPQLEQVMAMMRDDPALRLSVDGHTDDTGDAEHNRRLSEGRARSVAAALTAGGVDAGRLESAGHGASRPVADNATEEGRARNRRVELVKR